MRRRHGFARRGWVIGIAVAQAATGTSGVASAGLATAKPASSAPISRPGGLMPGEAIAAASDCSLAGVHCKSTPPGSSATSCSGYTSQTTPPATIRVLINTAQIVTVPFQTYVENVLPNEWISSWDADALGAGAVAAKSYAWYWVTHYGGYLLKGTTATCFDVTDDTNFQAYRANSQNDRTTAAVLATWPVAVRTGGKIVQASYLADLTGSSSESCGSGANGHQLSQWGTQNCNQASSGNKYNVILGKYYYPGLQLATAQQLRTAHDFQFQQRSTRVVFDAGRWVIDDGYPTAFNFGVAGDQPAVTTSGDGFAHIGVYRPSNGIWYLGGPTGAITARIHFGVTGDIPVQAQYAGEQKPTVLAMFRPSTGIWYEATSTGGVAARIHYGVAGDIPVPGHYAGTSATDYADGVAVFRPSSGRWYIPGRSSVAYGVRGDIPMPGDYDGNGTTDIAVYRPSTNTFYRRGYNGVHYGAPGDVPVTGDFTGNGAADLAVYRPSSHQWFVYGATTAVFGSAGDVPIGSAPYHD